MTQERKTLELFYPCPLGKALDTLRARLFLDSIERDGDGCMRAFTSRDAAAAAARRSLHGAPGEMYLVVITTSDGRTLAAVQAGTRISLNPNPGGESPVIRLTPDAQRLLSEHAAFGLEVVPGTEHKVLQPTHAMIKLVGNDDDGDWF